jgi:peptidoglycan/LPS O-acetylase OafA/YrhL
MIPVLAVLWTLLAIWFWCWQASVAPRSGEAVEEAYRAFTSTTHFRGLDGLRAISVIAVIWTHVTGPHTLELLNHGNKGVDLFFAISGFLVTTLLLKERRRTNSISLRNFYIRRTLRIFPLYYAVLALYCVLVFVAMHGTPKATEFWQNFPAFATYTANWFVSADNSADHGVTFYFAWSLATEEQFYLFWPPLLVASLARGRSFWLPALLALALVSVQIAMSGLHADGLLTTALASLAPAILFGAALAVLLDNRTGFQCLAPALGQRHVPAALAVLLLVCLQFDAPGLLVSLVMAVLVASVCLRQDSVLDPALSSTPLAFVGMISYGMYLMHMLAANAVRKLVGHQMGADVFVATLVLVVVMAYASHRWFETPVLRLKSRFSAPQPMAGMVPVVPSAGTAA